MKKQESMLGSSKKASKDNARKHAKIARKHARTLQESMLGHSNKTCYGKARKHART
jgi:hypothetical protein